MWDEKSIATERFPLANFFVRRFMRIVPIYWLGIILYSLIYGLASRGWGPPPELWHYLFHATLTNIFVSSGTSSVVPGGWSISVEAMFYLAAPQLFSLIKNLRSAAKFVIVSTIIGTFVPFVLIEQLPLFGLGMALFFVYRNGSSITTLARLPASIAIPVLAAVIFGLGFNDFLPMPPHLTSGVIFLLIGLFLMNRPSKIFVNQITILIGKMSYSAYLLHFLVIKQMAEWLPRANFSSRDRFITLAVVGIFTTLLLAYLSHRYIEAAINVLTRRIIIRKEARRDKDAELQPTPAYR